MSWLKKLLPSRIRTAGTERKSIPEGIWQSCPACKAVLYRAELERNLDVCIKCGHHLRIGARKRLQSFLDPGTTHEIGGNIQAVDVLKFRDTKKYKDRLGQSRKDCGESDALVVMRATLTGLPVVAAAFEYGFIGGSMGSAVGERFTRGVQCCIDERRAFINFAASGGARMQEGLLSLLQMAKTSTVLLRLRELGLPYISVLTDPTTGGVSASLGMLGDVIIAEPHALIGFAGPRVIEQTVNQVLPEGFQRSEFLLEHGAIDLIVDRRNMRGEIAGLLRLLLAAEPAG